MHWHNGGLCGAQWTSPYLLALFRAELSGGAETSDLDQPPGWNLDRIVLPAPYEPCSLASNVDSSASTALESPSIARPTLFKNSE
jgi:hypothetical protein